MNRQSFNPWLVDLGAGDFACALAAQGVIDHSGWGKALRGDETAILERLEEIAGGTTGALVAEPRVPYLPGGMIGPARGVDLAEAWKKFAAHAPGMRLELSIRDEEIDPFWAARELSRPEVGASSVYLAKERKSPNERWHWPLRVGLLDDPASKSLLAALKQKIGSASWARELVVLSTLRGDKARCDLLLLPLSLKEALSRVLELPSGTIASSVVITGGVPGEAGTRKLVDALDEQLQTNAIALVTVAPQLVAEWFIEALVRALSHDFPFDLALASSLGTRGDRPLHLLLANRDWLDAARLSNVTATLMQTMARPEVREEEVKVGPELAARVGLPEGSHKLPNLRAGTAGYLSETRDATTLAKVTKAVAPSLRRRPPTPEPRHLQAQVLLMPAGVGSERPASAAGPATKVNSFRPESLHRVDVRVGVAEQTWISAPQAIPEEKLPPSKSGHRLTVVFSEPHLVPQPQVSHVLLPPTGSSSTCSFYLAAGSERRRVQARVVVLYRNRVLQTSMLDGPVLDEREEASSTDRISFMTEAVVSPGLADLDRQASYGAAMVINHTSDGTPQVLKLVDDDAELVSTGSLLPSAQQIQDKLRGCDWGSKDFRNLDAKGTLQLLRFLAAHGSMLYKGIVKRQFIDERLAHARSIQLIAAKPDVRLPVEYFYDRPSPDEDAKLCPSAKKAIARLPASAADGSIPSCSKQCATRTDASRYVCPFGFWGLTRVLEWHLYRPQAAGELRSRDFAFQEEKLARRKQLPAMTRAVVGASDRANAEVKTSVADLLSTMKKNAIKATVVRKWPEWKKEVETRRPPLLVLIPHIDVEQSLNVRQLEIGTGNWLRVDQPEKGFPEARECPPVVLLLGCESGVQDVPFEDFVSALATDYAAVVVSSNTFILGRQATLLAGEFVSVLGKLRKKKNATFGEVMLAVRRSMLHKGYPMVLSVSAYGDADWRL